MSLTAKLSLVIVAFMILMGGVLWLAFRERKAGRTIAADDHEAQAASDGRVLLVIFGSIFGGMFLMLITAYLVFFQH